MLFFTGEATGEVRPVRVLPKSNSSCFRPQARRTDASKIPHFSTKSNAGGGGGGGNRVPLPPAVPTGKEKAAAAVTKVTKAEPFQPQPLRKSREAPPLRKREGLCDPEEGNGSQSSHWRKGIRTILRITTQVLRQTGALTPASSCSLPFPVLGSRLAAPPPSVARLALG